MKQSTLVLIGGVVAVMAFEFFFKMKEPSLFFMIGVMAGMFGMFFGIKERLNK